jgi:threonine synthase
MAKSSFRDPGLRDALSLTSANSINVGRFLPQSFYYVHAWARLRNPLRAPGAGSGPVGGEGGPHPPAPFLFSVPSGNFGNLAAGLLAKAMGLPGVRFLAATNANDAVPEYLATGSYRPRPSQRTLSTAMDVGDPSNLARIRHLYAGDLTRLRQDLTARSVSDEETRTTIRQVHDRTGVVLDPHTAVGFHALEQELEGDAPATGVLLATASPSKFAEVVEPTVGKELPIPPQLARGLARERRVTPMAPDPGALKAFLLAEVNRG